MRKYIAVLILLVTMLFSSTATAGVYKVKAGDTLTGIAQKHGMDLSIIWQANHDIKNPNRIRIGQIIILPEKYVAGQKKSVNSSVFKKELVAQKAVVSKPVVSIKPVSQKTARPWIPGSNPWRLSKAEGIKRLHFSPSGEGAFLDAIRNNKAFSTAQTYRNGKVFDSFGNEYRMLSMGFGKGEFFQPIPAWKDLQHAEAGWMYKSGNEYVMFPFICGNPTSLELVKAAEVKTRSVPTPGTPDKKSEPKKETTVPPIFKKVDVEMTRNIFNNELDLGGGIWRNQDNSVNGKWWFGQYKIFLEECSTGLAGGSLTPVVGLFAKGDLGETNAGYNWNNWGVGPQIGAMWNGTTKAGYPHQVQFMLRAIYMHMHGENGWSGYSKEEEHILIGYYLEYIRRFHPEYMTILYTEGWFDLNSKFNSTWSGDKATNLTQFVIGAKLHKDLSKKWAVRFGVQVGYQIDENRFGANTHLELRYNDWLIFGPSIDYCISSDAFHEAGGWAAGVFARVELKHMVQKKYTEKRIKQVTASPEQLLKY